MYKRLFKKSFCTKNPYQSGAHKALKIGSNTYNYYDINSLGDICNFLDFNKSSFAYLNKSITRISFEELR